MKTITQEMIRTGSKSAAGQREICGMVCANVAEGSREHFAYNDAGVFLLDPCGKIVLCFSWTITGQFLRCSPALDVTAYTKREELVRVGESEFADTATEVASK